MFYTFRWVCNIINREINIYIGIVYGENESNSKQCNNFMTTLLNEKQVK